MNQFKTQGKQVKQKEFDIQPKKKIEISEVLAAKYLDKSIFFFYKFTQRARNLKKNKADKSEKTQQITTESALR